jgi:hypothetical protein
MAVYGSLGKHGFFNIIFGFSFTKTAPTLLLPAYFRIMNWIYCYSFYYYFNVKLLAKVQVLMLEKKIRLQ